MTHLRLIGGLMFATCLILLSLDKYPDTLVLEAMEKEMRPQRVLQAHPLSPTEETCRLQGRQWMAYRNSDQWTWIRVCVSADLRRM